jgi:hypothetical protein
MSDAEVTTREREPLLPADQAQQYRSNWEKMQRLAAGFSEEREQLENQWDSGDDVSTEHLRVALTRYRSFFDRLLSA